jgi:spore coat polysaccharide biosynthesis protein SpsF
MPRTVLIMQARMGSTRLPGKVLKEVLPGRTMLDLTIERLKSCRQIGEIVIAAPEGKQNEPVAREAEAAGASVFRGPEEDVLGRYLGAAQRFGAELVVRVTSDCPLIDPAIVDLHIERMRQCFHHADFVTNMTRPSFPHGLAVEVMPIDTLERMDRLSTTPHLREHVTTLAFERPELFAIEVVSDD